MQTRWEEFLYSALPPECIKYRKLMAQEDPESNPYESRYAAAAVQEKLLSIARTFESEADSLAVEMNGKLVSYDTVVGRLHVRRGLALIETDLLAEAEKEFQSGLARLAKRSPCQDACVQVTALNNLGILYCNRQDYDKAEEYLLAVESVYKQVQQGAVDFLITQGLDRVEDQPNQNAAAWLEQLYTMALFYLAQVYQKKQDEARAASCCATTLCRQLKFGMSGGAGDGDSVALDHGIWIQNAAQLACYYFNNAHFAVAEHVLNAASAILAIAKKAGTQLEEDVEANVEVGWARYLLARMDKSVALPASPDDAAALDQDQALEQLPSTVAFEGLQLPPSSSLPWGRQAVATTFDEMRALFNAFMPHARAALQFYQLDGWVTEHVQLLFDIALAYRNLAWFEKDPHRRCVMHKQRVKQFEKVDQQLSFQHYPGLVRSIMLECANAHRDIFDVKQANSWPADKVSAAGMAACHHYDRFLTSIKHEGVLPLVLEQEWERPVLNACLSNARICHKASGLLDKRSLEELGHARDLVQYALQYVQRNKVEGFEDEMPLCQEFLTLIEQKLQLMNAAAHPVG